MTWKYYYLPQHQMSSLSISLVFWKTCGLTIKLNSNLRNNLTRRHKIPGHCSLAFMDILALAKFVQICPSFLTIPCAPWNRFFKRQRKAQGQAASCLLSKLFFYVGASWTVTDETSRLPVWLLFLFNLLVILQLHFYFWFLFFAEHPKCISFVGMACSRMSHSASHLCPKESHVHSLFLVVPIKKPLHPSFEKLFTVFHLLLKN